MVGASVSSNAVSGISIFGRADTAASAIIANNATRSRAGICTTPIAEDNILGPIDCQPNKAGKKPEAEVIRKSIGMRSGRAPS
jgi:hypothetical protein